MAISGEEYLNLRSKQIQRKKRIITVISMVSFLGSIGFAGVSNLKQALSENPAPQVVSQEGSWKQQEQGLETVLQREPENQVALEGLVNVRMQLKNKKGAVDPLEKLVKLYPQRQDYKVALGQLQKQVGKGEKR